MISPDAQPRWRVKSWEVTTDGSVVWTVIGPEGQPYSCKLTNYGGWSARRNSALIQDEQTFSEIRRVCARHIIDRAFGGKD